MKFCRFKALERTCYGVVDGSAVVEIKGNPFDRYDLTSVRRPLDRVKLLVPYVPRTFYAAGLNYLSHIQETAEARGEEVNVPQKPDIGYRAVNALIAHEEPIVIPKDATEEVQYEGELVVVISKTCRNVTEEQALDYVLGYSIGNDVSERTWQKGDRTMWRAKNTDTFKPMGPWIVTDLNPDDLHVVIKVNDRTVGEYDVASAIFGVRTYISKMSQYLTLVPGDVLWMGTDGATENMVDGDVCTISINGIGTLTNKVNWQK